MAKDLPKGRVRRAAKVGRLAGEQTARGYATKATNLGRSKDGRRAAAERRQVEAAEQIFEVLGQMKGAAMKVGQVASFIDTGAFPPEFQERVQAKLAELRDAAPRVPFEKMRKVVEDDLGEPLEEAFAEFDPEAVAAASIGQVYRARLHDGRAVAVKVQYPGVAQAVRADLQNLGLIMRVAKRMAPGMDVKAMTREIRERLTDELDYEHEAQNHRAFARTWSGHPFIYVPPVVTRICTEHVLVTEWVEGIGFEEVRELDSDARDRFGEIVFRFFFGSLYRTGSLLRRPAPRQLPADARRPRGVHRLRHDQAGVARGRGGGGGGGAPRAWRATPPASTVSSARMGFFDPGDEAVTPEAVLAHIRDVTRWYIEDGERTIDRELVAQVLIDFGDPRSEHWELMKRETMPPQAMLARQDGGADARRAGQLGATANWHLIAREWLFGDPPSTALGAAEHGFHARAAA